MIKEQMREVKAEEPLKMKKITQWESSYPQKKEVFGTLGPVLSIKQQER